MFDRVTQRTTSYLSKRLGVGVGQVVTETAVIPVRSKAEACPQAGRGTSVEKDVGLSDGWERNEGRSGPGVCATLVSSQPTWDLVPLPPNPCLWFSTAIIRGIISVAQDVFSHISEPVSYTHL